MYSLTVRSSISTHTVQKMPALLPVPTIHLSRHRANILTLGIHRSFRLMVRSTSNAKTPVPRLSASLIVVNNDNEVLLVHRPPKASVFAGVHVFPGGHYDEDQDASLAMTAVRETFEEAGLLIAEPSSAPRLSDQILFEARQAVHSRRMLFRTFLKTHRLTVNEHCFLPFTQWITPTTAPRRFHAHFFINFLPGVSHPGAPSLVGIHHGVPTSDGGQEVLSTRFVHPKDSIAEFAAGKIALFPPQFYILTTLAEMLPKRKATLSEREKLLALSRGAFGQMVFNPRFMPERDEQGHHVLTFEGDETRGGSKGRRHRILCKDEQQGGAFAYMALQRNFDIFSEIETTPLLEKAKI